MSNAKTLRKKLILLMSNLKKIDLISCFSRKFGGYLLVPNHHEINVDYKMALETIPNLGQIYDEPE